MRIRSLAWVLSSCLAVLPPAAAASSPKIDPALVAAFATAPDGRADMIVVLAEQADLSGIDGSKRERGREVYRRLTGTAQRTQAPLLGWLAERRIDFRSYWVHNVIWASGDLDLALALADRLDVARLDPNPRVAGTTPPPVELSAPELEPTAPLAVEWNIAQVNANDVWALGFTGQGVVVAGQDTGYDWDHPALRDKYRGWNGSSANHNYQWHDAIHQDDPNSPGPQSCGFDVPAPCDDQQHGTHTMGTMIGDDGAGNQIGMAPGARWIGCRNMEEGYGTPTTYIECFEWFIAPTNIAGTNPDPALAPHVINNSWGCPPIEGCNNGNFAVMNAVVEAVRTAGIVIAVSAGNSGSSCESVDTPAAIFDGSFTVGATNSGDNIAGFSSRGPVGVDSSDRRKPDISAPGVDIRSSVPGTGYDGGWQGTSMAAPHVAGHVALLISANPAKLEGNVDGIEELIQESALHRTNAGTVCTSPGGTWPNNTYGWGRIDALASVQLLQSGLIFRDDFHTGDTTDWSSRVP